MESIFLKKEGASLKNKVLNFLIIAQDFDYSLKDIADNSEISYASMKSLKKLLIREEWIVHTRNVGRAEMYKLNIESKKIQKFVDFFWSVVNEEVGSELNRPVPISSSGILNDEGFARKSREKGVVRTRFLTQE
ncbi:MAG: hypothetical protein QF486_00245 [Candidatus Woesearchaeota archaeon]|jgi:hypothetical protein|nr:hypothetical protein [Candidatus Woesearchaeota archaeon]MDP7181347.1 hypothetical protein [Candidatus Woesearchaeota archaeon]MDP7198034.1 hypothetical protein [Candidatus Woesearchaeota archaeon]MDP7466868.1 hypothetical protein [Candidatus Woesearchaeota archaeon]MDP7647304.1 hypothetical protein [Candidatus Woesearchaeota archaeon]|tara:strand:+ start:124 stop:525 length:402 start_codon:yes stop_codon:yes gene_type:complete